MSRTPATGARGEAREKEAREKTICDEAAVRRVTTSMSGRKHGTSGDRPGVARELQTVVN
jgi:hypothetical protein